MKRLGFGDQLLDDRKALVAFAIGLSGLLGEPAEDADKFNVGGINQPAAGAVGVELDRRLEAAHRAVLEIAHLHDASVLLPLAIAVLPAQPQRPQARGPETVDAPLRVGALYHLVDG